MELGFAVILLTISLGLNLFLVFKVLKKIDKHERFIENLSQMLSGQFRAPAQSSAEIQDQGSFNVSELQ